MLPKAKKPSTVCSRSKSPVIPFNQCDCSKSPVVNRPSTKKAKKNTIEEETAYQQQLLNQQQVPQQESLTLKNLPPPELMDTEPISSVDNSSKDKGKNPKTILDEDQVFYALENMLNTSKDNKNILTFECDNDTSTLYAYCAAKKFFLLNPTKKKLTKLVLSSTDCSSRHSL
ncbi:11151_t:CDS:1, partial [Funneliformis geosporum]